uniref:Uncharacterized protein n=1 Tax=Acinetobacter phage vB_Ab_02_KEN_01 TaxID=3143011 RepID=A0AAU8KV14_9VIRU
MISDLPSDTPAIFSALYTLRVMFYINILRKV